MGAKNFRTIHPDPSVALFVKDIMIFEDTGNKPTTTLPFFADGYPGLMFQETENGLIVSPHDKKMPLLFLYGQTIKPIELVIEGAYKLIVFQLYPFVIHSFFNVTAKEINDGCFDLQQSQKGNALTKQLTTSDNCESRIQMMSAYILDLFEARKRTLDLEIAHTIQIIIDNDRQIPIAEICGKISLTERTFERRFVMDVGISAKQFSSIIRFQRSLGQLASKDFSKITDVVYKNGYADQSHFIKVFKAYTGRTPKAFT